MEFNKKDLKIFVITGKARHGKDTTADIIRDYYENKNMKTINNPYAYYMKDYAKRITGWDGSDNNKPREFLQQFGTNLVRNKIDNEFFINRMVEDLKVFSYFYDVVTISDGRFPIEVDTIRNNFKNVTVIKVVRPNFDNGLTEEQKNHPTEIALDDYKNYDYIIENDKEEKELKEKIIKILEEIGRASCRERV